MCCINRELIQKFIDGETSIQENARIEMHLSGCKSCAAKIDQQRRLASGIKDALNSLVNETDTVLPFMVPAKPVKKSFLPASKLAYLLAAACIITFILIFAFHKKNPEINAGIITIEPAFATEVDANRPASQQSMVLIITDSKGNRSEFFE